MKLFLIIIAMIVEVTPVFENEQKTIVTEEQAMSKITFSSSALKNLSTEEELQEDEKEDVSVFVKLDYDPFTYNGEIEDEEDVEKVEQYRRELFQAGKNYHLNKNNELMEEVDTSNFDNVYVNKYAPFFSIHISKDDITNETYSNIVDLAYNNEVEVIDVKTTNSYKKNMANVTEAISCTGTESSTYIGNGIKVGILETGIVDVSHSNMNLRDVTVRDEWYFIETVSEHATQVASVIVGPTGIAMASSIYSAQLFGSPDNEMDWMLDNGIHIINCSYGELNPDGVYSSESAYMDYIVYTYKITIVAAVGNEGNETGYVGNPGMGYNVIGVGASDYDFLMPVGFSSYLTQNGFIKPNILAPGVSTFLPIFGAVCGTSFAAPVVTGVLAKLFEQKLILRTCPELAQGILACSAKAVYGFDYEDDPMISTGNGAGVVNYARAKATSINTVYFMNETNETYDSVPLEFLFERGDRRRIAISWLAYADGNKNNTIMPDYDIELRFGDNVLFSSSLRNTNTEIIQGEIEADGFCNLITTKISGSYNAPRIGACWLNL